MRMPRLILTVIVVAVSGALYFVPPPAGISPEVMHSAALVLFTVGFWAAGVLPEHVTALLFFLLAMVFAVAPAQVIFSGFASPTLWLVLGGLIMAQAVNRTGLGSHLAGMLFDRFASTYGRLLTAVVIASVLLCFVMPATISRVLLLAPIVMAAAERAGFESGSNGYNGLCLAAIFATYQCGTTVLPANAPNLILAGSADTLYGVQLHYAEYLWYQFPVLGLLKAGAIIVMARWLLPATVKRGVAAREAAPLTPEQWRMAVILIAALALWATDFLHGIKAGWVALGAGIACILPRIGVMSYAAFNDVKMGAYFYVGATIGLGLLTQKSGLSAALDTLLHRFLDLRPGANFLNYAVLSLFSTVAGLFTTNTAQPAVLSPLSQHLAQAAAWPLKTTLMTLAVGFSTVMLPYQVPPVVVGVQAMGLRLRPTLRLALPLAAVSLLLLVPLNYLWWHLIGAWR